MINIDKLSNIILTCDRCGKKTSLIEAFLRKLNNLACGYCNGVLVLFPNDNQEHE